MPAITESKQQLFADLFHPRIERKEKDMLASGNIR
jgi:hypothetical protein